jgi:stage III sporulation protein AF
MPEAIRSWVIGIACAAMITAIAMTVTPEGSVKKAVALVCGLVVILTLIKPIVGFDYTSFSKNMAQYRNDAEAFSSNVESVNENLTRLIIEEECAAYILDKGTALGITDLEVTVTAEWSEEGYWYPSKASLKANADEAMRFQLGRNIEAELGIPPEELTWSMSDEE